MKKYVIMIVLASSFAFGQEEAKDKFRFDMSVNLSAVRPISFGNNALAKAHNPGIGGGIAVGLVSYGNLNLYGGIESVDYDVTDKTKIGNIETTGYSSAYGAIRYRFEINEKFSVAPTVGFGSATLKLKTESRKLASQKGSEFRAGGRVHYNLSESTSLFVGANFIYNNFPTHTHPDYERFFSRASQIQLSVGIMFD